MRNLVLSAFPRAMRLPDPFTPNLKVTLSRGGCCCCCSPSTTLLVPSLLVVFRWA